MGIVTHFAVPPWALTGQTRLPHTQCLSESSQRPSKLLFLAPLRGGNRGSDRGSGLPKVTQLVSSTAGLATRYTWFWGSLLALGCDDEAPWGTIPGTGVVPCSLNSEDSRLLAWQGRDWGGNACLRSGQPRVETLPRPQGTGTRQEVETHSCSFLPPSCAHTSGQNPGPSGKLLPWFMVDKGHILPFPLIQRLNPSQN